MSELKITEDEAKAIIKKSVEIAVQARKESNQEVLIAGSVGPYGACLHDGSEYSGTYIDNMSFEEITNWHRPRIQTLIDAGADLLAFETIPSIKEARALVSILKEFPNARAWLSVSCQNDSQLCYGDYFMDAYEEFRNNPQLVAVGINCTSPFNIHNLLKSIKTISKPLIVYSNDGSEWDINKKCYVKNENLDSNELILSLIPKWVENGVKLIGGCCRIDSNAIAKFREFINQLNCIRKN